MMMSTINVTVTNIKVNPIKDDSSSSSSSTSTTTSSSVSSSSSSSLLFPLRRYNNNSTNNSNIKNRMNVSMNNTNTNTNTTTNVISNNDVLDGYNNNNNNHCSSLSSSFHYRRRRLIMTTTTRTTTRTLFVIIKMFVMLLLSTVTNNDTIITTTSGIINHHYWWWYPFPYYTVESFTPVFPTTTARPLWRNHHHYGRFQPVDVVVLMRTRCDVNIQNNDDDDDVDVVVHVHDEVHDIVINDDDDVGDDDLPSNNNNNNKVIIDYNKSQLSQSQSKSLLEVLTPSLKNSLPSSATTIAPKTTSSLTSSAPTTTGSYSGSGSNNSKVNRMSGTDLAYIGDAVYELYVRSLCVWPSKRTSELQNQVVSLVRAERQSRLLQSIKGSFPLTEDELQVIMRGRNSVTKRSSTNKNKVDKSMYQDSTAFEALIGYLYISNPSRCCELLTWLETIIMSADG